MRPLRWLLPSVSHWLWLLLLVMLLSQPWRTAMVASDGDPCMHWRTGEWMLEHRQVIRTDVFSHTRGGRPYVALAWLAEIVYATAARFGGLLGLDVVAAVVIATTFALLHRQLLREGNDLVVATLLVILAAAAASQHWLARPLVFTQLGAFLCNDALRRFERNGRAWRLCVGLGLLMLLWANLHAGFFLGFVILGAYWAGAIVEFLRSRDDAGRRKIKVLTGAALLCGAISLMTPYGYRTHLSVYGFLRSSYLLDWFGELSSTQFSTPAARGFLVWLGLMFFTLAGLRPRLSPPSAVVLVVWTYLGLYAVRNVPVLTLLSAPLLAPALSEFLGGRFRRWRDWADRLGQINSASRGWPVVAGMAIVWVAFIPRPLVMPAKDWPVGAVEYIRRHEDEFRGRMFNQYVWGGYLLQALPAHPVFVDGRADFYGEELLREFSDCTALRPNWVEPLQKYQVAWTLMPSDHRLNLALAAWGRWRCAYSDEVAMVWRRIE